MVVLDKAVLRKRWRDNKRKYRAQNKAEGLCTECPEKRLAPYVLCKKHLFLRAERQARYWNKHRAYLNKKYYQIKQVRKAEERCVSCGKALIDGIDAGYLRCINCRIALVRPRGMLYATAIKNSSG